MKSRLSLAVMLAFSLALQPASSQVQTNQARTKNAAQHRPITGLVLDEHGEPVADAQIIAHQIGSNTQMIFVSSGSDGRFRTPPLAPGLYAVAVQSPAYILDPDSTHPGMHRPGDNLTLHLAKGGVITGRVTDASGAPLVAAGVTAHLVQYPDGRRVSVNAGGRMTDDRGVYRLYGLEPGRYVVSVSISTGVYASSEVMDEAPTYYPSTGRAGAVEVAVQMGEEVAGIDIEHRRQRGHAVSGTVSEGAGSGGLAQNVAVHLINAASGEIERTAGTSQTGRFAFYGLPDGEYDLYAQRLNRQEQNAGSAIRRVVVRGADLTGVDLKLIRYGVITGRVIPDADKDGRPAAGCTDGARLRLEEIRLDVRSNSAKRNPEDRFFLDYEYWGSWRGSMANQKGEFTIYNLVSGSYRLNVNLPGDELYVRSLARRETGAGGRSADISRASIAIKPGEKIGGIEVNIGAGAVRVRGRVLQAADTLSAGGPRQAPRLLIHLIPAEEAAAGDLLRYGETLAGRDGSFEFRHLAPGKYWLLARPAPEADAVDKQSRPLAWDDAERARLRRQAAASSAPIDLKPCQRLDDYTLKTDPK